MWRKELILKTQEELNHIKMQKYVTFVEEESCKSSLKKYRKVRDHCHYTGKYRAAANSI